MLFKLFNFNKNKTTYYFSNCNNIIEGNGSYLVTEIFRFVKYNKLIDNHFLYYVWRAEKYTNKVIIYITDKDEHFNNVRKNLFFIKKL